MSASKKDFIAEAEELLEEAGRLLVEIQETAAGGINPDTVNALFRSFHTLKGISGLFGFKEFSEFSHGFESLLDDVRLGKLELTDRVIRFLFGNVDILRRTVADITSDRPYDLASALGDIRAFHETRQAEEGGKASGDPLAAIDPAIVKVLSEYEEHRLRTNIKEGKGIYLVKTAFALTEFDKGLSDLTQKVKAGGELIATLPTSSDVPPDSIGFHLLFGSPRSCDELRETLGIGPVLLTGGRPAEPAPKTEPQAGPEGSLKSSTTSVRVNIDKLDAILNTISELSLARSATARIAAEMKETYGHDRLAVDVLKISQAFGKKITEIQEQVLAIRMVPIGQIFSRLTQGVRRYAREAGKQIEIVLYGEETEIDKFLAEEIIDPLMHIVRNAMDHGIERTDVRRRQGKPEQGTITLKAFQKGHHVVIEVSDDGAGIDLDAVERKAREKGLIEEGAVPDAQEVLDFIFMPGFSTKAAASDLSGRGVGMDVVKSKLVGFGGHVDVSTERGKGASFTITTPITLAIVKTLFVRVGPERFGIPLTSIAETLLLDPANLQTIEGREVYNLRGDMLPLVTIGRFFEIADDPPEHVFIVVIRYGERSIGFVVDELLGQSEVVIKSLSEYFEGAHGFAGAAEVGKHEIVLIIDVEAVVEESVRRQKAAAHV